MVWRNEPKNIEIKFEPLDAASNEDEFAKPLELIYTHPCLFSQEGKHMIIDFAI